MKKTRIFTNSVSDISPQLAEKYNITLVPDTLIFGEEQFLNNIDINPQQFYEKLSKSAKLPTSAHPNIYKYCEIFQTAEDYEEILFISLTGLMSGSVNTARIAKQDMLAKGFAPKITIYDSLQVSFGLAFMVIEASKLAQQGKSAQEIVDFLDVLRPKIGVYFVMPSLQNARKGGRIGVVKCFTADAMGIKPILCFDDGLVRDVGLVRGYNNAKNAVFNRYVKEADYQKDVFVFHSNNVEAANKLKQQILSVAPDAHVRIEWVGAVIGIYTGEGAVGVAFCKK